MTQLHLEPGRALLIRLEPGLDRAHRAGLFDAIKHCPGVDLVCDLSIVSRETLDVLLLPDDQKIRVRRVRKR